MVLRTLLKYLFLFFAVYKLADYHDDSINGIRTHKEQHCDCHNFRISHTPAEEHAEIPGGNPGQHAGHSGAIDAHQKPG